MCLDKNFVILHPPEIIRNKSPPHAFARSHRTYGQRIKCAVDDSSGLTQIDLSKVDRAPTPTANAEDTPARQRLPLAQLRLYDVREAVPEVLWPRDAIAPRVDHRDKPRP